MLYRHSSRRLRLDQSVLHQRLDGAIAYDRIAGYFKSSLFEIAGEELLKVQGKIRIICNSELDPIDIETAASAQAAIRRSWCAGRPEEAPPQALPRYKALYEALVSEKVEIRVLPDFAFGLVHGKAGIIRYPGGRATSFIGSVNETTSAWKLNYELLWEDDDPATVSWVQEEFDALWNDPRAVPLACCPFITQDVHRIIRRKVITPEEWKAHQDTMTAAASASVETPVYRREQGLWPHQKYFAKLAIERHRLGGARLILADQVGLGKTIQLAVAAMLMALDDPEGGPILVLAPKPLLQQWQGELMELLHLPSARWNGRAWVDENDVEYPGAGARSLGQCPRRIGLVSQGLVVRGNPEARSQLLSRRYTCVIVDEAHRARRSKIPKVDANAIEIDERAEPNKLMAFLREIEPKTKSMLLATATPVQLHPLEAWDLLDILSCGNDGVLGGATRTSKWYQPSRCLNNVDDEEEDVLEDEETTQLGRPPQGSSSFKDFTKNEAESLHRCLELLKTGGNNDPKLEALIGYLLGTNPHVSQPWIQLGCILFSQYYDTVRWVGDELAKRQDFNNIDIGLYAGSNRSGFWRNGRFQHCDRNDLKLRVRSGELRLILGTDAASEGLNLQRLGTLINIDLPWNPTRLEQRKGRIQRIGQPRSEVWIANLRYRDSVEDRVHDVLAGRLEAIHGLFGQIPDTLEDVWVQVALNNDAEAKRLIDRTSATRNPFDIKYSKVEDANWENCEHVLNPHDVKKLFMREW